MTKEKTILVARWEYERERERDRETGGGTN
jgi:hypothetical protein